MKITLIALLSTLVLSSPQEAQWPTLREVLMKHGLEGAQVAGIDDADRRITSFDVKSEPSWFGIAYYWYDGELLPSELRVRTLDRVTGAWRHATLDARSLNGGSAVGLARAGRWIYLDLHITPSAGALVVLTEDLVVKHKLAGWSSLVLRDGRVIYENNMVHFAPYHPAAASLFDPSTGTDQHLYPAGPIEPPISAPQDRSIARIVQTGAQRIAISVTEQDLRWRDNTRTEPVGPERKLTVSCDLSGPKPRCTTETAK